MSGMVSRMDDIGRPAWFAAMIGGFLLFWPLGLGVLAYMIGSGRMGCSYGSAPWSDENRHARWERKMARMQERMQRWNAFRSRFWGQETNSMKTGFSSPGFSSSGFTPTGNRAFDEYRMETIKRLEDEAGEFRDFLERLRHAKDKAEFDSFVADRRERPTQNDTPRPGEDRPASPV